MSNMYFRARSPPHKAALRITFPNADTGSRDAIAMLISLFGFAICLIIIALLAVRWRVVCRWNGGFVEVHLRFLGLSRRVWSVDLFEHTAIDNSTGLQEEQLEKLGAILGRLVDRIEALIEHREVVVRAGRAGLRLARRFRHWWRLDRGTIELTFGLKNPAHTGMTHGALSAVSGVVGAKWPQIQVVSRPDFDTQKFDSRGEIVFSIRAWDPVKDLVRFAATLPWRGLLRLKQSLVYQ